MGGVVVMVARPGREFARSLRAVRWVAVAVLVLVAVAATAALGDAEQALAQRSDWGHLVPAANRWWYARETGLAAMVVALLLYPVVGLLTTGRRPGRLSPAPATPMPPAGSGPAGDPWVVFRPGRAAVPGPAVMRVAAGPGVARPPVGEAGGRADQTRVETLRVFAAAGRRWPARERHEAAVAAAVRRSGLLDRCPQTWDPWARDGRPS